VGQFVTFLLDLSADGEDRTIANSLGREVFGMFVVPENPLPAVEQ
jgi:hypothetical protein